MMPSHIQKLGQAEEDQDTIDPRGRTNKKEKRASIKKTARAKGQRSLSETLVLLGKRSDRQDPGKVAKSPRMDPNNRFSALAYAQDEEEEEDNENLWEHNSSLQNALTFCYKTKSMTN